MKNSVLPVFFLVCFCACTSKSTSLVEILSKGSAQFKEVLDNPKYEVQIIYGEISGDSVIHHEFHVDDRVYFYPASTVKMPVAFAAIKKAQEEGISLDDAMMIDSTGVYPRKLVHDSIFQDSITIRNMVRLIFAVSDNQASNVLYGWMGKDYLNESYQSLGISTRIVHQLGEGAFSFKPVSNRYSRQAKFFTDPGGIKSYDEVEQTFQSSYQVSGQQKGHGFIDSLGALVEKPFDFSRKNFIPLRGLLQVLELSIRPDLIATGNRFDLSEENQSAVLEAMELLPSDLPPPYDTLNDNYVKFLMFGNEPTGKIPESIKIRNKVGWAYGYLLDVAYIEDTSNEISFFLAAVIHVNENNVYNDGVYEYDQIGLPFLDELGDLIYSHEVSRSQH